MAKMMKTTHRKATKTYPVPPSMSFSKVGKKMPANSTHSATSKKKK